MSLLVCSEHGYTLQATCPKCGKATASPGPAKYSPEDRFGKYRRKLKLMERAKMGASERSERAYASTAATAGDGRAERS